MTLSCNDSWRILVSCARKGLACFLCCHLWSCLENKRQLTASLSLYLIYFRCIWRRSKRYCDYFKCLWSTAGLSPPKILLCRTVDSDCKYSKCEDSPSLHTIHAIYGQTISLLCLVLVTLIKNNNLSCPKHPLYRGTLGHLFFLGSPLQIELLMIVISFS